ncbi:hypothetical protein, partial [Cytobacillus oceanisediminis]|uniref:hypothetical protein n=1 Tax=Cytobacillus oceanisediminis TaxID=665099 RepID=UPI0021B59310
NHLGVRVRQMIPKVGVIDAPETDRLPPTFLQIHHFTHPNPKPLLEAKIPPTPPPLFLAITKASLHTDSFLSAPSFQQTTTVLTHAPIKPKRD